MRTVAGWRKARSVLERWRRNLTSLQVTLKRPRAIDVVPVDFISGEPVARAGEEKRRFKGELVYFTKDDCTLRRASGALLVIDTYELESLSDRRTRVIP